jgi:hypothetical protein
MNALDRELHLYLTKVLLVEIAPDFISARTKEASAKRKGEEMKLGWPVRPSKNLRLDPLTYNIKYRYSPRAKRWSR